jgi:hypothetical protein
MTEKEQVQKLFEEYAKNGGVLYNLVDKIDEIYNNGTEKILWTNGNAFRKYQGQDKIVNHWGVQGKNGWKKVRAIIRDIV